MEKSKLVTKTNKLISEYDTNYDILPSIFVIGDAMSGKTSLISNLFHIKPNRVQVTPTKQRIEIVASTNCSEDYSTSFDGATWKTFATRESMCTQLLEDINNCSNYSNSVYVNGPDMIPQNIVELPGLAIYPPELAASTKEEYDRWLREGRDNIIIICACPATISNIYSSPTVAYLLDKPDLIKKTIFVLTMVDKLVTTYENNIETIIINHLDNKLFPFTNCIIKNHYDNFESSWFQDNMVTAMIKNGYSETEVNSITKNIGTEMLEEKISKIEEQYIKNKWFPQLIDDTTEKVAQVKAQINELGLETIKTKEFLLTIKEHISGVYQVPQFMNQSSYGNGQPNNPTLSYSDHYRESVTVANYQIDFMIRHVGLRKRIMKEFIKKIAIEQKLDQFAEGITIFTNHIDNYDFTNSFKLLKKTVMRYISDETIRRKEDSFTFDKHDLCVKINRMYNIMVITEFEQSLININRRINLTLEENAERKAMRANLVQKISELELNLVFVYDNM
jgi:GTPase SAR1 family protein